MLSNRFWVAGLIALAPVFSSASAGRQMDVIAYFAKARSEDRDGLARKTKIVDVRAAQPGEVVTTIIKGEGKETQSKPAKPGDQVVRNRCAETGNEEYLVAANKFASRYEGPIGSANNDGWQSYRPRGREMRFTLVRERDGSFSFQAPWGEQMVARPGDAIVQDPMNEKDTYRVQGAAFACTYEIIKAPKQS